MLYFIVILQFVCICFFGQQYLKQRLIFFDEIFFFLQWFCVKLLICIECVVGVMDWIVFCGYICFFRRYLCFGKICFFDVFKFIILLCIIGSVINEIGIIVDFCNIVYKCSKDRKWWINYIVFLFIFVCFICLFFLNVYR